MEEKSLHLKKTHTPLWVYLHKSSVKYSFFHLCTTHDNIREISSHMLKSPTGDEEKETSHWSICVWICCGACSPEAIAHILATYRQPSVTSRQRSGLLQHSNINFSSCVLREEMSLQSSSPPATVYWRMSERICAHVRWEYIIAFQSKS